MNAASNLSEARRWNALNAKVLERRLSDAVHFFNERSIKSLTIKGWVTARCYPEGLPREYGDVDLCVSAEDYPKVEKLIASNEFPSGGVDLHRELRHHDSLRWEKLHERSEGAEINGVSVRFPCPEDHLRIICVHWLTDGGEYKERLWDIYYAVANRPATFDWDKCLSCVSETRRGWVISVIGLAHRYLDLPIDDLPFADEAKRIPKWLTECLEKEWASDVRLRALHVAYRDPRFLLQQIRKRIPPNPIQSSIDTETPFDDRSRVPAQLGSIVKRIGPSLRRFQEIYRRQRSK